MELSFNHSTDSPAGIRLLFNNPGGSDMPRKSRELEILASIREYLKHAVCGLAPITDDKLMEAANCARATFYRYVAKESQIEGEIETARRQQEKYACGVLGEGQQKDTNHVITEERAKRENAEEGTRTLLGYHARLISNLMERGVSMEVLDRAQRAALSMPDRSFSHAGHPRRRVS
jgi:hypothetical protein